MNLKEYQRWFNNRIWLFKWYEMRQLLCECTMYLCQPKFGCLVYRETNECSHQTFNKVDDHTQFYDVRP